MKNTDQFWKEIILNPDGTVNLENVLNELADYSFILEQVPKVYSEISGGLFSKPNYYAKDMIQAYRDNLQDEINEALRNFIDEQFDDEDQKEELKHVYGV